MRARLQRWFHIGHSGQAMLEFVLVFPVVLLLMMGIMEFSLLSSAHQVVDYAAFNAARSASVGGSYRLATALSCLSISPSAISKLNPHDIPGLKEIAKLVDDIIGIDNAVEKAAFAYLLTTHSDTKITYYNSAGNTVSSLSDAAYLVASVVYFYPLKFSVVSTIAALASRSWTAKIPVIGDLFYISNSTDKLYFKYFMECEALSALTGLKFVPIIKTCTMGLN